MPTGAETVVIAALSVFGAASEAVVAYRWYEPPSRDGETPSPVFEAGLFFVGYGLVFGGIGYVLTVVGGLFPPFGTVATLLLAPIGFSLSYAAYSERIGTMEEEVERFMGVVAGIVVGLYPVALLLA